MNFLVRIVRDSLRYRNHSDFVEYLASRGVSQSQIESYRLGYFPEDQWPPYIDPDTEDAEIKAYLKWSGRGARLRGKVIFPLETPSGQLAGICIRSASSSEKGYSKFYLQLAEKEPVFFGTTQALPYIWETGEVNLVEGNFDLFPLQRQVPNVLCTMTAKSSVLQNKFLTRFVERLNVWFDMDEQGESGFHRLKDDLSGSCRNIERVTYGAKDLSDLWNLRGEETFAQFVQTQQGLL